MTTLTHYGVLQYKEALADPLMRQIEPGLIMRPFHAPDVTFGQQWHVYCERHPAFGFCGSEGDAANEALDHGNRYH